MKKNPQLSIRIYGEHVGILEQNSEGKKLFTYDPTATMPISLGMPIRKEPYQEVQCEAFFGGLLPESEAVKKIIGKKYGISPHNSFSILREIGYDCAGAISCHAIDDPIQPAHGIPLAGTILSEDELYQHIIELPQKPLFMDIEGLRLSLAGVQEKAAICLINNQIAFPKEGCPTTHILKPESSHFEGMSINEYFILKIAKKVGLPVPEIELKQLKDITFLLIERYDRRVQNNTVERIHQEDIAQALGIPSSKKYQNEGGPGFEDCFELLKNTTQPAVDRNLFASAMLFNYLVGNMDAHAKNFSLLHHGASHIRLAPFYDLVCTRVYSNLTSKMAMKIGSKYDADSILPRHWQQLCEKVNYRYIALRNLLEKLAYKIIRAAEEEAQIIASEINSPMVEKIKKIIVNHINQTLKKFGG